MRRRLAWLGEQIGWLIGVVSCLLLMLVLLHLVPFFELYGDIRKTYKDR